MAVEAIFFGDVCQGGDTGTSLYIDDLLKTVSIPQRLYCASYIKDAFVYKNLLTHWNDLSGNRATMGVSVHSTPEVGMGFGKPTVVFKDDRSMETSNVSAPIEPPYTIVSICQLSSKVQTQPNPEKGNVLVSFPRGRTEDVLTKGPTILANDGNGHIGYTIYDGSVSKTVSASTLVDYNPHVYINYFAGNGGSYMMQAGNVVASGRSGDPGRIHKSALSSVIDRPFLGNYSRLAIYKGELSKGDAGEIARFAESYYGISGV